MPPHPPSPSSDGSSSKSSPAIPRSPTSRSSPDEPSPTRRSAWCERHSDRASPGRLDWEAPRISNYFAGGPLSITGRLPWRSLRLLGLHPFLHRPTTAAASLPQPVALLAGLDARRPRIPGSTQGSKFVRAPAGRDHHLAWVSTPDDPGDFPSLPRRHPCPTRRDSRHPGPGPNARRRCRPSRPNRRRRPTPRGRERRPFGAGTDPRAHDPVTSASRGSPTPPASWSANAANATVPSRPPGLPGPRGKRGAWPRRMRPRAFVEASGSQGDRGAGGCDHRKS